jgi:coenzyme PQQ precursor peptide PqqA
MDFPLRSGPQGHRMVSSGKQSGPGQPSMSTFKENRMSWEKPQAVDMRWGFEVTMYIANR